MTHEERIRALAARMEAARAVRAALDARDAWRGFRGSILHDFRCGPEASWSAPDRDPLDPSCDCGVRDVVQALDAMEAS